MGEVVQCSNADVPGADAADASLTGTAGLRVLAPGFAVALLAMVLPYSHSVLARFRPWVADESFPIVRLFVHEPPPAPMDQGASEEELVPTSPPTNHVLVIAPSEYEGVVQEIEDPQHALRAFYDSLRQTGEARDAHITRVAHFGDSSIALDGITQTVRQRLQRRFGDAGHGFVLAAKGTMPYRHRDVRHESNGVWRVLDISRLGLSERHYGLGGAQARASSGATASFATAEADSVVGTRVARFDIFYEAFARGGLLQYRVDGAEWNTIDTRGAGDQRESIAVADGPHELEIRTGGRGEVHVYGVVLERAGPGVVYDSLGMVGARVRRFSEFTREHLARQLELRGTDLMVVGFGGNDADDDRTLEEYTRDFRAAARLVRSARPNASCLLFATLDQGQRDARGVVRTMPAIPRIVEATRSAALAEGCAFYNTYAAMGGDGAMGRWMRQTPRLATGDFRHATPAGYRWLGTMFSKALLKGLADHMRTPR